MHIYVYVSMVAYTENGNMKIKLIKYLMNYTFYIINFASFFPHYFVQWNKAI